MTIRRFALLTAGKASIIVTLSRLAVGLVVFSFLTTIWHEAALVVALIAIWAITLYRAVTAFRREPQASRMRIARAVLSTLVVSVALFVITEITQRAYYADMMAVNIREIWLPWMDVNIPDDGAILVHPQTNLDEAWQNPPRTGLIVGTHFTWRFLEPSMLLITPRQLVAQGIAYFSRSRF